VKPDEIKLLLGGYATGTLTPEEQKALFDAALEDQTLFDALAREQALKETLDSPAIRRDLLGALETAPSWRERFGAWLRWPYQLAGAAALAAAAVTVVAVVRLSGPQQHPAIPTAQVAENRTVRPKTPPAASSVQPAQPESRAMTARKPATTAGTAKRVEPAPPSGIAAPAAAPPPPAPKAEQQVTAAAESVRVEPRPAQTEKSLAASDARSRTEAREMFYAPQNGPAPPGMAGGVIGGVIGGVPDTSARGMAIAPKARASRAAMAPAVAPLGVRYSIVGVPGATPELQVESNADAVLYVFRRDETGAWIPVAAGGISLKAHVPATTPAIEISARAPEPRAVLILSRVPLTDLAQSGAALTAAIDRLRAENTATPLVTGSSAGSTFVATPRPAPLIVTPLALP
jgi:hypothetical protein